MSWWMLVPIFFLACAFVTGFISVVSFRDHDPFNGWYCLLLSAAFVCVTFFTSGGMTACGSFTCGSP